MKLKQIRILTGESQYDVFSHWQRELFEGFRRRRVPVEFMSVPEEAGCPFDAQVVSLGFNLVRSWGSSRVAERPHIAWSVDHPGFNAFFFLHRLKNPEYAKSAELMFVDRARCELAGGLLGLSNPYFLPHAASAPFCDSNDWKSRATDVVFFGSLSSIETRRKALSDLAGRISPEVQKSVLQTADSVQFESGMESDLLFWNYLNRVAPKQEEQMKLVFLHLFPQFDMYLRCLHRIRFFSELSSMPIHIYGAGEWEQVKLHPDSVLHGPVEHCQIPEIMRQSKVVINHGPTLRDGAHERVFDALASGCAVLSTPSPYLKEQFGTDSGVVTVFAGAESKMVEQIAAYVSGDRQEEIVRGQRIVRSAHTFDVRAGQILQFIERRWGLN